MTLIGKCRGLLDSKTDFSFLSICGSGENMEARVEEEVLPLSLSFRLFATSKFFIAVGGGLFSVFFPWMVLSITGSSLFTGIAEGLISIPLLLSFFTGTFVDRTVAKKAVFLMGVVGLAAAGAILIISIESKLYLLFSVSILAAAFLYGLSDDVQDTSAAFFDKSLLRGNQIKKGSAVRRAIASSAILIGYLLSAYFIYIGFLSAIFALILLFLLSGAVFLPVHYELQVKQSKSIRFYHSMKEGFAELLSNTFLKELVILAIFANFFFGMISVGFAVLVRLYFHLPVLYYSIVLISLQLGAIGGSIVSGRLKRLSGAFLILSLLLWGILFSLIAIVSLFKYYDPIPITIFFIGFISGINNVALNVMMLKRTSQEKIGRIFGSLKTALVGVTFASGATVGALMSFISPPIVILLMGSGMLILAAVALLGFENVRKTSI